MTKDELYKVKGELITQIEVSQAKLKAVNEQIIKSLNDKPGVLDPEDIDNDEDIDK